MGKGAGVYVCAGAHETTYGIGSSSSSAPSCLLLSASLTRLSNSFNLRTTSRSARIVWKSFCRREKPPQKAPGQHFFNFFFF